MPYDKVLAESKGGGLTVVKYDPVSKDVRWPLGFIPICSVPPGNRGGCHDTIRQFEPFVTHLSETLDPLSFTQAPRGLPPMPRLYLAHPRCLTANWGDQKDGLNPKYLQKVSDLRFHGRKVT